MMSLAASLPPVTGLAAAPGMPPGPTAAHFDDRETRPAAEREEELMARLPHLIRSAKVAKGWAWLLSGTDARSVTSREALARLPVLRRADLAGMQAGRPPFGGLVPEPVTAFKRVFASPGGFYAPEAAAHDAWLAARALFAAGLRKGDIVVNCQSYHLAPAGFVIDSGCRALGCPVVPAGPSTNDAELDERIAIIEHLAPVALAGTAERISKLLHRAAQIGRDVSSLRIALIGDGPIDGQTRAELAGKGIVSFTTMTTAELGVIAYETSAHDGFVLNEGFIAEIVHPGTGDPVEPGDAGELVITTFDPHSPFVRLGTGMISAQLPGTDASGRTNTRLAGWLCTADQAARVGEKTVTPAQIAQLRRRHPGLGRLRLTLSGKGGKETAVLSAETRDTTPDLQKSLAATLLDVARIAGQVELVAGRRLPNDGRVIADERR